MPANGLQRPAPEPAAANAGGGDFVLVAGARATPEILRLWFAAPGPILGGWFAGAMLTGLALLVATLVGASLLTPDLTLPSVAGVGSTVDFAAFSAIFGANLLVLALHGTACVAGFIAGSSLPRVADEMTGLKRWIHEQAGRAAIVWVGLVTCFSLLTQSLALGFQGATLADAFQIAPWLLVLTALPHALLELTAIFLPLAAWLIASRNGQ